MTGRDEFSDTVGCRHRAHPHLGVAVAPGIQAVIELVTATDSKPYPQRQQWGVTQPGFGEPFSMMRSLSAELSMLTAIHPPSTAGVVASGRMMATGQYAALASAAAVEPRTTPVCSTPIDPTQIILCCA